MKFNFSLLVLLFIGLASCKAQKPYDMRKPYKGVIVTQDVNIYADDKESWFKPTIEEARKAEELLAKKLNQLNKDRANQGDGCPDIEKNISKYVRQYIGYADKSGNKVIFINMIWSKGVDLDGLDSEYVMIFDGCSRYWIVKVNLETEAFYDLDIKGSA